MQIEAVVVRPSAGGGAVCLFHCAWLAPDEPAVRLHLFLIKQCWPVVGQGFCKAGVGNSVATVNCMVP
jgi:hypothetical protein